MFMEQRSFSGYERDISSLIASSSSLSSPDSIAKKHPYKNFFVMSIAFALNQTPASLSYASTLLGDTCGGFGVGFFYISSTITSLMLSQGVVKYFGAKRALVFGCFIYVVFTTLFSMAAVLVPEITILKWILSLTGFALGGSAYGFLWTAQGQYFALNAHCYAENKDIPYEEATAYLSGLFSTIYFITDMSSTLFATLVLSTAPKSIELHVLYGSYIVISTGALYAMHSVDSYDLFGSGSAGEILSISNFKRIGNLMLSQGGMLLLVPFQCSYGVSNSFINYYVYGTIIPNSPSLGVAFIGTVSAISTLTSASMAKPFAKLADICGKNVVMSWGAVCFAFTGICLLVMSNNQIGTWAIVIPYFILYGMGAVVYQTTNRDIVATLFAEDEATTTAAFASITFIRGLSGAMACFAMPLVTSRLLFPMLITIISVLAVLSTTVLLRQHKLDDKKFKKNDKINEGIDEEGGDKPYHFFDPQEEKKYDSMTKKYVGNKYLLVDEDERKKMEELSPRRDFGVI